VPLYTADALVLRTYKLGEADRIVVFLTRDRGKKRGVAKGARRPRSRFAGALEPLTEVRMAYFEKERRELVGLNYAETVRSPMTLAVSRSNVGEGFGRRTEARRCEGGEDGGNLEDGEGGKSGEAGNGAGGDGPSRVREAQADYAQAGDALGHVGYFAELIDEWAQESDADERLYRLGVSMLDALGAGTPVEPLARYFEYWLLRLQGVYPESRGTLSPEAIAFLARSRTVAPQRVGEAPASRRVLDELRNTHRALIAMHLEKTLKSDRVLRDLRRHA
jgi:Recombination protein O N terminal/Recombination protein O C terminal